MPYQVRWRLVGRSERALDHGHIWEAYERYGDAVGAVNEFLRPYPSVRHCGEEGYWLARRSEDADLAVWVWIERQDQLECCAREVAIPPAPFRGSLWGAGSKIE
jgi:hypothetical protein